MPVIRERPPVRISLEDLVESCRPGSEAVSLTHDQGEWTEAEYLNLDSNHLVEFSDGKVEVLPMPTSLHQRILLWLFRQMIEFVESGDLGEVLFAALPIRIAPRTYREPDIIFLANEHADWDEEQCLSGADLVIEIVSPSSKNRDLVQKRAEYARAKIPEYWIVNAEDGTVRVLNLKSRSYEERTFVAGEHARSRVLDGFQVAVDDLFNSALKPRERRKKS